MDPHWTSYVGMATGIIGALTGAAGAIMGYISYRKTNQIKSLDLRIELKKQVANFKSELKQIKPLMEKSDTSRKAVASASGRLHSGWMELWGSELNEDYESIKSIETKFGEFSTNYSNMKDSDLENSLLKIHNITINLQQYYQKYEAALSEDDKQRENIRADARQRLNK